MTAALLLELAAADDVVAFRRAVEEDKVSALDAACQWYGPSAAGARPRLELRTPAMVAALYGSTAVLAYVLSAAPAEAARASPTDGATPLHLAAAGGAAGAVAGHAPGHGPGGPGCASAPRRSRGRSSPAAA